MYFDLYIFMYMHGMQYDYVIILL